MRKSLLIVGVFAFVGVVGVGLAGMGYALYCIWDITQAVRPNAVPIAASPKQEAAKKETAEPPAKKESVKPAPIVEPVPELVYTPNEQRFEPEPKPKDMPIPIVQKVEPRPRKKEFVRWEPAPVLPDRMARLDRNELTPQERDEMPAETVAVIPGLNMRPAHSMAFAPDGKRLALGRGDGSIELWDLTGTKPQQSAVFKLPDAKEKDYTSKLAFSNDGAWLASVHGLLGGKLQLWALTPDGAKPFASRQLPRIDEVAFQPDNNTLVFGAAIGRRFAITDSGLEELPTPFQGAQSWFTFANGGKTFAAVVFNPARNGLLYGSEVQFWTVAGKEIAEKETLQHDRFVKAMALSPDGATLATATLDLQVRFWDLTVEPASVKTVFAVPNWLRRLHFTPDGARLIVIGSGNDLFLWNVVKGEKEKSWQFPNNAPRGPTLGFAINTVSPDGRYVVVSTSAGTLIMRLPLATEIGRPN